MIDRLEASGVVRRVPDTVDRRAFRIHLGEDAGAMVERMRLIVDRTTDMALQGLSAQEKEQPAAGARAHACESSQGGAR